MSIDAPAVLESPAETCGRRAAAALEDPALAGAFARLEQDIVAAWRGSPAQDREAREWLYLRLTALGAVREELRLLAEEGRLAERERLRREHEAAERRAGGFAAGDPP
jgi:hypothetical protein